MAYEKQTWTCGDTITADKLNHMEDGIANSGGDCGYSCSEGWVTLTDESVTTAQDEYGSTTGTLAYSTLIDADTVKVTFNGVEYICENRNHSPLNNNVYGAPYNDDTESSDWSEYPFFLIGVKSDGINVLGTETAGTYQVKIEAVGEAVETSECFRKAVKSVGGNEPLVVHLTGSAALSRLDKTWQEINDAFPNAYAISSDGNVKMLISKVYVMDSEYLVDTNGKSFSTSAADDYPLWTADMN